MLHKPVDPALLRYASHFEANYEIVEKLLDIKEEEGVYYLLAQWEGLPDTPDLTWEPLDRMYEDAPDLVNTYLAKSRKKIAKQGLTAIQQH